MKNKISLIVLIALSVFSCKNHTKEKSIATSTTSQEETHQNSEKHWTYEGETGPDHWAEIEKQSDCDGKRQSPINIIAIDAEEDASLQPINIVYSSDVKIHEVINNGHSIQYNFEEGDYITLDDKKYNLKQIHFHEASEHTINGVRYPLEMHLVHVSEDNQIAVLGVLAEEGESSEPFNFLEKYLPVASGETKTIDANFDLNLNLPENREYYTYGGSLTTPPCTENVTWYVFKNPIKVSLKQVKQLQELMPLNNYRNEQPINDRTVKHYIPK